MNALHSTLNNRLSLVPLVVAPLVIWAVSSGSPAVVPSTLVGVIAVLLVGLKTVAQPGGSRLDGLLAVGLGVLATHLLFMPGFPRGHDISTHLWGTYGFIRAILDGNPWPRWIHHMGLGMPFLLLYAPMPFYLTLPFHLLDLPVYDCFKYAFVLFNAVSGYSLYWVVNRWTGSRSAALAAAGLYCFAPYHLAESNYRVAIAEACAMMVLPPFFYHMHRAIQVPSQERWRWAALFTALLAVAHPLSLVMAGTGMGIWLLVQKGLRPDKRALKPVGRLALLGLLGVGLAGFFTVPVIAEGPYSTVSHSLGGGGGTTMYAGHGLTPDQLVVRRAWTRWQKSEKRGSPEEKNEMPFYFGLTFLVLLPLVRPRADRTDQSPHSAVDEELTRGLLGLTLGSLALTLTPLDWLLGYVPTFTILQFPWRYLAIATCGAGLCAGVAIHRLQELFADHPQVRWIPVTLFALGVIDFWPYGGAPLWQKPYTGIQRYAEQDLPEPLPLRVDQLQFPPADARMDVSLFRRAYPEYFTPATKRAFLNKPDDAALAFLSIGLNFDKNAARPKKFSPEPYAAFIPADAPPETRSLPFTRGGEQIRVTLPGQAGTLIVKEQFWPGWDATLEGETTPDRSLTLRASGQGLMTLPLKADDTGTLVLSFSRTRWDRSLGLFLSVAIFLGLFVPGRRRLEPLPTPPGPTIPSAEGASSPTEPA